MQSKTTSIASIKQEVRLQEWTAQIEAQQASGLTVQQWCVENGIKPNTYYNRLKRVREQYLQSSPAIVPLNVPQRSSDIRIEKNAMLFSLILENSAGAIVSTLAEKQRICYIL